MVRIAFDPEAIPEHPGAQLASFGTPLIDRLLADAVERGRPRGLYLVGLNLSPHGLDDRLRRAVTLPQGFGLEVGVGRGRCHFPQAVFWFEATFVSDQKEQEILPVAIDLHHGRQVRHLDRLARSRPPGRGALAAAAGGAASGPGVGLSDRRGTASSGPSRPWPTRASASWRERLTRQLERIARYYADLRTEVEEQVRPGGGPRRGPRPLHRAARGPRPRGAAPRRRAPAEEPVEGPPPAAQPRSRSISPSCCIRTP